MYPKSGSYSRGEKDFSGLLKRLNFPTRARRDFLKTAIPGENGIRRVIDQSIKHKYT
jgi:hypothetical protein